MNKKILHPKFIGYWFLLLLLYLIVQLPYFLRMKIGEFLGKFFFIVVKSRKKIVKVNLEKVFPNLSEEEKNNLLKEITKSIGYGFIETGMAWFYSTKKLKELSYLDADPNSLKLIEDKNVPVILVGSHSTILELGVRLLGIYTDSAGMYRPLKNPFFEEWIKYQRGRAATQLIHFHNMRLVLSLLKEGNNIWYALDQDMGIRTGVFAPFFDIPTCSVNILPQLTKKTKAHWIPVFMWRENKKYVVRIMPEIPQDEKNEPVEVMTKVNKIYENEIKKYIPQYFWVHRRFKTRPNNEPYFY